MNEKKCIKHDFTIKVNLAFKNEKLKVLSDIKSRFKA